MRACTILLNGELYATERLKKQIESAYVIAVDGGMKHAKQLSLTPQLWLGDFDSCDEALKERYKDIPQQRFPHNKDKTDGALAIEHAVNLGARKLILCGAFGGERFDHALLHVMQAVSLAAKGYEVLLTTGRQEGVPLLAGEAYVFKYKAETLFSIIALDDLKGLEIKGAKWNLENTDIDRGLSRTLSNRMGSDGTLELFLRSGNAILVTYMPS